MLLRQEKVDTVEQRRSAWRLDAFDTAGRQRAALDVTTGFILLLRWIVRVWHGDQIVLTLMRPRATTASWRW